MCAQPSLKIRGSISAFLTLALIQALSACGGSSSSGANDTNNAAALPTQYNLKTPTAGSSRTFNREIVDNNNGSIALVYSKTVDTVNPDGSFSGTITDQSSNIVLNGTTYDFTPILETVDTNGRVLTQVSGPITCSFVSFQGAAAFPNLYVGKTWSATWTETCSDGFAANFVLTNGTGVDVETVTVPAGTFNTIKIQYQVVETITNPAAAGSRTASVTNWLDTTTGTTVRIVTTYSYSAAAGTNGRPVSVTDELQTSQ